MAFDLGHQMLAVLHEKQTTAVGNGLMYVQYVWIILNEPRFFVVAFFPVVPGVLYYCCNVGVQKDTTTLDPCGSNHKLALTFLKTNMTGHDLS